MAYSTDNQTRCIAQSVGADGGDIWYYSDADPLDAVLASNYFSDGNDLGMVAGDIVLFRQSDSNAIHVLTVSAVGSSGATVVRGDHARQELTVSGAVNEGVEAIELNHNTTVIAATIADLKAHEGLLSIKDTSSSGTAAHTVTATVGTFDGTNNIAALNAPGESLLVYVDSAGNGVVVENIGTVGLST